MRTSQVSPLAGMRDLTGRDYESLTRAAADFAGVMSRNGYALMDTPLLERTELFVRKSGGEMTSQLYTFVDPGGHRVSLRPEFTSSVIRHFIAREAESDGAPVRLQYGGPVFRYSHGANGSLRQFTQVGAELIGGSGVEADVEVLSLAFQALTGMGLTHFRIRIGHVGVVHDLLSGYGLSETAKRFAIGSLQPLKLGSTDVARLMEHAKELGLLGAVIDGPTDEGLSQRDGEATRGFIQGVLTGAMSGPIGRRTSEQIVERLMRKVREANDPDKLRAALELVSGLARVAGSPFEALEEARGVAASHGLKSNSFDPLDELSRALIGRGVNNKRLTVDFGLAMGLGYYTGLIFELTANDGASLGSGGRYDGLVKAFGGDDTRALGFAFTLEEVVSATAQQDGQAALSTGGNQDASTGRS